MLNVAAFSRAADLSFVCVASTMVAKAVTFNCGLIILTAGTKTVNTSANYITNVSANADGVGSLGQPTRYPHLQITNYSPAANYMSPLNNFL